MLALLSCACAYTFMGLSDRWLAQWVMEAHGGAGSAASSGGYAGVYLGLSLGYLVMMLLASFFFNEGSAHAGKALHCECLSHILHAPVSWFEETPSGRIISRFSTDLSLVDMQLIRMSDALVQFTLTLVVVVVMICIIVPLIIPAVVLAMAAFYLQYVAADRSQREIKRLANNAMSPVLTNVAEVIHARTLIRVMGYDDFFHRRHCGFADEFIRLNHLSSTVQNWSMLCGSLISSLITALTAVIVLAEAHRYEPTLAGLALTYSYLLPYFMMQYTSILGTVKVCLTALERLLEYRGEAVPQEAPWELLGDAGIGANKWPSEGAVEFKDVVLVYRPGLPPALRGVSFCIAGGERVGVIGRTGAGKSSLMVLLFRVCEATSGQVLIDGVDVASVGLQTLRKRLTVVPQEPLLMAGTVRANLDPFGWHTDPELAEALYAAGLGKDLLDSEVGDSGRSISAGEAQLVSFARTLLRRTKVVVMDEPTSNIDAATDEKVQRVVRSAYAGSTLLTVAHRLETVIDGDRILVMDAGQVAEFAPAAELLADPKSHLSRLVQSLGPGAADRIRGKVTCEARTPEGAGGARRGAAAGSV